MAAVLQSAADAVTPALAAVGLTDTSAAPAAPAVAAAAATATEKKDTTAQELSAAEGRRLYIGNLAYVTTEDELKTFFEGYQVESISIPTNPRTTRAVGYAFVDVATKEEADRAIANLSGKEILERKVSVQTARKPGTAAPPTTSDKPAGEDVNGERGERAPRRGRNSTRGRGRGRGGRRGVAAENAEADSAADPASADSDTVVPVAAAGAKATTEKPAGETTEKKERVPREPLEPREREPREERAPRKRGPPENGVPSTTKIMVANLPYELTEESLKELFAAYDPESAKIALRPIPRFMVRKLQARNEPRKGRGFGFVTLSSTEMQQKAVAEMNGKMIQDREIAVKVAIDNPAIEAKEGEADENEQPAEAANEKVAVTDVEGEPAS